MDDATLERYARLFHEQGRLTVNAERAKPFYVRPWEERSEEQKEIDRRGVSAVAAAAVADAKLENTRRDAQLFALSAHRGAIFDALKVAIAATGYESVRKRFRAALEALGGKEEAS